MAQRTEVLRTYRMLMRAGRTWPTVSERQYILSEARRLFRLNRALEEPAKIEKKLFEASSRWELAQFYGIAAPRYFYNQPGMVEKARNKTAIHVRPAYLDSEYERIGRGQGDDERNRRSTVGGSVPERAARAAAAAAAVAERSARGAILSALHDPQENVSTSNRPVTPKPPGLRMPPQPPGLRKKQQQPPSVPTPPPLRRPLLPEAGDLRADPASGAVSAPDTPSAETGTAASGAESAASERRGAGVVRKKRRPGTDRSRHRVPTHLQ